MTPYHRQILCLLLCCSVLATPVVSMGSAKILLYHHVSEATPKSTSVTPAVFDSHLDLLEREGFEVVPLARIVDSLLGGGELDSRWVAITFDDAFASVGTEAAPRLEARGWPYTVFVSTGFIDDASLEDLQRLVRVMRALLV